MNIRKSFSETMSRFASFASVCFAAVICLILMDAICLVSIILLISVVGTIVILPILLRETDRKRTMVAGNA